jgi:ferric-dicitrate binding protein FerR (iron transport regulator)
MEIKVLGTRFNVCAYPDENQLYATLEEGKIEAKTRFAKENIELKPGEQLVLNLQTKKINVDRVDTDLYTSWKENLLRFEDAPFSEVITKMERWYDVDIEIGEAVDINRKYTMTIKTESLREMLRLLSLTTPIAYEINESKVSIHRP